MRVCAPRLDEVIERRVQVGCETGRDSQVTQRMSLRDPAGLWVGSGSG